MQYDLMCPISRNRERNSKNGSCRHVRIAEVSENVDLIEIAIRMLAIARFAKTDAARIAKFDTVGVKNSKVKVMRHKNSTHMVLALLWALAFSSWFLRSPRLQ